MIRSTITLTKTPSPYLNVVLAVSLTGAAVGVANVLFAAEQKQARVTEVIHDVRLLAARAAARPAAVNDTIHEGTAVRTGTDSRAELTFTDLTLTRLGANTVFSFGAATRTYNLGSGAILMSAPKQAGTIKITTAVATSAVSGFTAILERHSNTWNKFILLHGHGTLTLKGTPGGPCHLQTGQMVVFPPHPTHYPPVLNIDISKLLNGKLVKGFKGPLPELNIILADIERSSGRSLPTAHRADGRVSTESDALPAGPQHRHLEITEWKTGQRLQKAAAGTRSNSGRYRGAANFTAQWRSDRSDKSGRDRSKHQCAPPETAATAAISHSERRTVPMIHRRRFSSSR